MTPHFKARCARLLLDACSLIRHLVASRFLWLDIPTPYDTTTAPRSNYNVRDLILQYYLAHAIGSGISNYSTLRLLSVVTDPRSKYINQNLSRTLELLPLLRSGISRKVLAFRIGRFLFPTDPRSDTSSNADQSSIAISHRIRDQFWRRVCLVIITVPTTTRSCPIKSLF